MMNKNDEISKLHIIMNSLAELYLNQEKYDKAEPLYHQQCFEKIRTRAS